MLSWRNLGRLREIVAVATRHGFGDMLGRLDLPVRVPGYPRLSEKSTPRRLREAFEELGPTFVKLGQLLSTRPDLLSVEYLSELERLHDNVPPIDLEELRPVIERALGAPVEEVFERFDSDPLAAASIGQVHRARIDGREVVLKIRRPGIERKLRADLDIMRGLARMAQARLEELRYYDIEGLMEEFRANVERELDFTREANHMRLFHDNFADEPHIIIPQVLDHLSNDAVLTMEFIDGVPISRAQLSEEQRHFLARVGLRATFKQVFEDGVFHADPHPGNVMVVDGNALSLLDFGQVGRVDGRLKDNLATLLTSIVERDYEHAAVSLVNLGEPLVPVDMRRLTRDVADMVDFYATLSLGEMDFGRLIRHIIRLIHRYQLRFPGDYALLLKALMTIEDTGRRLDPDVDVVEEIEPYVRKLVRERWQPDALWRRARWSIREFYTMWRDLPRQLQSIVEQVNRGQLTIEFKHVGLDDVMKSLNRITNKVTMALVFTALIISSSLVIQLERGPQLYGYSLIGWLGYAAASFTGIWLFYLYWR